MSEKAEDRVIAFAYSGLAPMPHEGSCGPESGCDTTCMEYASLGEAARALRKLISSAEADKARLEGERDELKELAVKTLVHLLSHTVGAAVVGQGPYTVAQMDGFISSAIDRLVGDKARLEEENRQLREKAALADETRGLLDKLDWLLVAATFKVKYDSLPTPVASDTEEG